jgi:hypothetical protein
MNWTRISLGLVSITSGTLLGAFVGGALLARLFVIDTTGFDAIADALGYAMLGAGLAFIGTLYLAWQASLTSLRRWALSLGLGAVLLLGLLFWRSRQTAAADDSPAPFPLTHTRRAPCPLPTTMGSAPYLRKHPQQSHLL